MQRRTPGGVVRLRRRPRHGPEQWRAALESGPLLGVHRAVLIEHAFRGDRVSLDPRPACGHTAGMTSTLKIAVSLPRQVAERARRAVRRGHAASVSAYVAAALEEKV